MGCKNREATLHGATATARASYIAIVLLHAAQLIKASGAVAAAIFIHRHGVTSICSLNDLVLARL
jgi:hypothetical protein